MSDIDPQSTLAQAQANHYASNTPTMMDNYGSSIVLLTSTSPELYELRLTLLNATEDEQGNIVPLTKYSKPLLNDDGISAVLGLVGSIVKRSGMLNSWDDNQVYLMMMKLFRDLSDLLTFNKIKYGVTDIHSKRLIISESVNIAYLVINRGYKEGERKFWGKITHEMISKSNTEKRKKGLLSTLDKFGGE